MDGGWRMQEDKQQPGSLPRHWCGKWGQESEVGNPQMAQSNVRGCDLGHHLSGRSCHFSWWCHVRLRTSLPPPLASYHAISITPPQRTHPSVYVRLYHFPSRNQNHSASLEKFFMYICIVSYHAKLVTPSQNKEAFFFLIFFFLQCIASCHATKIRLSQYSDVFLHSWLYYFARRIIKKSKGNLPWFQRPHCIITKVSSIYHLHVSNAPPSCLITHIFFSHYACPPLLH